MLLTADHKDEGKCIIVYRFGVTGTWLAASLRRKQPKCFRCSFLPYAQIWYAVVTPGPILHAGEIRDDTRADVTFWNSLFRGSNSLFMLPECEETSPV